MEIVTLPGMPGVVDARHLDTASQESLARRLDARTARTSGCWIWTGAISSPDGYGRISITQDGREFTLSTHRAAFAAAGMVLGTEDVIENHCNEPLCVRVDERHVHISTQSENMRYAVRCGRQSGSRRIVDSSQRVERSRAVRDLALAGFNQREYEQLVEKFSGPHRGDLDQLPLF